MLTLKPRRTQWAAGLVAALLTVPALADMSATYDLRVFNNPGLDTTGLLYMVEVSDYGLQGAEGVRFRITNDSTARDSVITAVYFDDGVLLDLARVSLPDRGVWFTQSELSPVSPWDMPGGNGIGFSTTEMFGSRFAADVPAPDLRYGINNGEYVDIFFTLKDNQNIADALRDMNDGTIRVGIHVQQLGDTGRLSASAVNLAAATIPVPAPGAALLGLIGLGLVGALRRRDP